LCQLICMIALLRGFTPGIGRRQELKTAA